jgi:biofilm PGA synthesis lipoprotein PgaB
VARFAVRLGVAVTTLVALAVPTLTFVYVRDRVQVGAQARDLPQPPPLAPAQSSRYASFTDATAPSIVVLGYHDVVKAERSPAPPAGRRVSVSAVTFAAHLRMLELAGFTSITDGDLVNYVLNGGSLPARSVLITFDGARVRDWTYADRILADYGYRATVFVDPAIVDRATKGTTLSWAQLRALVDTGRWTIGMLPSTLAGPVVVDETGREESGIVAHRWLPEAGRAETTDEFSTRVRDKLSQARQQIVDEGLPPPALLSYPFQADYPIERVADTFAELATTVHALFSASVLTGETDEVGGPRWIGRRLLPRIEVYGSTTDDVLFSRIRDGVGR